MDKSQRSSEKAASDSKSLEKYLSEANLTQAKMKSLKTLLLKRIEQKRQAPWKFYEPLEKMEPFHASSKRVRWLFGGNRSGKTVAGGKETADYAAGRKKEFNGPAKIIVAGRDFPILGQVMWPAISKWFGPGECPDDCIGWHEKRRRIPGDAKLPNGSSIIFRTYEMGSEKFASFDKVDLVWFDETPPKDIYQEARMRILDTGGRIIVTMTPWAGRGAASSPMWIYQDVVMQAETRQEHEIFYASIFDNKYIPRNEIDLVKDDTLSEDELQARMYGKFMLMMGRPVFDRRLLLGMRAAVTEPIIEIAC